MRLSRDGRSIYDLTGRVSALALACLAGAACGDATAPLPTEGPPRELTYSTGGFAITLYNVRLAGDTVVFTSTTSRSGPEPIVLVTRRVPRAEEWRTFWRTVRDAGVSRWPGECYDHGATDGGTLDFVLAWDGTRRTGHYYAAFPSRDGTCANGDGASGAAASFRQAVFGLADVQFLDPQRTP
ncbi:hypothetical protein tb265_23510 [Gemmatimonadetes bacterium T265]|nr:hypothetical protein tb265_23510 [Gemmatimonadetes bacterium T265]